ncbi:hypothetical protein [Streptomyces sp. NPDC020681]|uniref:hypothetical protein n=1 Tax=Streptomyces sp. NPDC020681 TaxID=3365083 RepID=UPI0037A6D0B9
MSIAPGESVQVPVTADPQIAGRGRFSGHLSAVSADGTTAVHTSIGMTVQGKLRTLTLKMLDRHGKPAPVPVFEVYGSDYRWDTLGGILPGGNGTARVTLPEDTYFLKALIPGEDVTGGQLTQAVRPEVELTGDRTVVLDARTATPVNVRTPKPSEQQGMIHFGTHRAVGVRDISSTVIEFDTVKKVFVTPTEKVRKGTFELYSRWRMVAPRLLVRAQGAGAPQLNPVLFNQSPPLDGSRRLPVVFVGTGSEQDLAGKDLRGKLALMRADGHHGDQIARVAAAGASAGMVINEFSGPVWKPWTPEGERDAALSLQVPQEQGEALVELLKRRPVTLELSGTSASSYLYDLTLVEKSAVPARLDYTVKKSGTATVVSRYHRPGRTQWTGEQRFAWRPWQATSFALDHQSYVKIPSTRVETVSAGDTLWRHRVTHQIPWNQLGSLAGGLNDALRVHRAGRTEHEDWFGSVIRPAAPQGVDGFDSVRDADRFTLRLPEFADSGRGHYGFIGGDEGDRVRTRLYRDGELVADGTSPWGDFPAGPGRGTYQLLVETSRKSADWNFSTETGTRWSFTSAPSAKSALLPLIQLDYDVPVDTRNLVRRARVELGVTARHQDGFSGPRIARLQLWTSTDDGVHWTEARHLDSGGHGSYTARVDHSRTPAGSHVSLRVKAWDTAGNAVEQTVLRAYGIAKH